LPPGSASPPPISLLTPLHSLLAFGFTGGLPANFGGISIIALSIITATGFRSLA
jgi:hypothetical protein